MEKGKIINDGRYGLIFSFLIEHHEEASANPFL